MMRETTSKIGPLGDLGKNMLTEKIVLWMKRGRGSFGVGI